MAKKAATITAGKLGRLVATWALRAVGIVPIYYAAKIAHKASEGQGEDWAAVAVITTVAAAVLILGAELSFRRRMFAAGLIMLALGVGLDAWCMVIASGNVAAIDSKAVAENKKNETDIGNLQDRRTNAVERRDQNKKTAAGETEESALAKIAHEQALKHPSASKVAALNAKAAAAKAYNAAVKEIADIDAKLEAKGVVAVSAGQTAGVKLAALITKVGHIENVDGEAVFEWGRGGILELLSSISLAVMDLLAWLLLGGADEAEERRVAEKASKAQAPKRRLSIPKIAIFKRKTEEPVVSYPVGSVREFRRRYLEEAGPEDKIKGGDMQKLIAEYRAESGLDRLDEKTVSQQLQAYGVEYKKKSGRTHYYGVKFRDVPLPAVARQAPRLAVDNTGFALAR